MTMNIATTKRKTPPKKARRKIVNLYNFKIPNIIIVAEDKIKIKFRKLEEKYHVALFFTEYSEISNIINDKTIAIIIDEKMIGKNIQNFFSLLTQKYKFTPIYFLSRTKKNDNFFLQAYEKGLQAIINWPKEASILPSLLIETLKPHPKAKGANKKDEKLADVVKSHLIINGNYKAIKVKSIDGLVFLTGKAKTLSDIEYIKREAQSVLGVKKIISKNLSIVLKKSITDKELSRKINLYISHILPREEKVITSKVKNGNVIIHGTSTSIMNIVKIENFCKTIPGVKSVIRDVTVISPNSKKRLEKIKLVEKKIYYMFSGVKKVRIKMFKKYAEVSGIVTLPADKELIEAYILQTLPVNRVINKIIISRSNS